MSMFQALSPNVEVNGETVLSIINGMGAFRSQAESILTESGIVDPKPGQWFSQQKWLNAFKKISEEVGPLTLAQIGRAIPQNAKFPPQINSIEKALAAIDEAYHMNHRGGAIGNYKFQKTDDRSAKIVCENPYPCEFDFGIIEAMAKRFAPIAIVTHEPNSGCRKKGTKNCTYIIQW